MENPAQKELFDQLLAIDGDVYMTTNFPEKCKIVIVGGAGMIALGAITRRTLDIDAMIVSQTIDDLLEARGVNTRVNAYLMNFPYNFEDRLVRLELPTRAVDFYTASLEDLVISKLHSPRPKDEQDITSKGTLEQLDWETLHRIACDPAEANELSDSSRVDFVCKFEAYEKEYRPCGN